VHSNFTLKEVQPADELAVPDDDDAPRTGPLVRRFPMTSLLVRWCRATDENDSVAAFPLVHSGSLYADKRDLW